VRIADWNKFQIFNDFFPQYQLVGHVELGESRQSDLDVTIHDIAIWNMAAPKKKV
jgi:hypothetical protein